MKYYLIKLTLIPLLIYSLASIIYCEKSTTNLKEKRENHPIKKVSYWKKHGYKNKGLTDKILPAPKEVIEYLHIDNALQGYPNRPKVASISDKQLSYIKAAIKEIPEPIKKKINEKLFAIFFVEDLGGSGYGEGIEDKKKNAVGAFLVFDSTVLNKKANEWATWKENDPFKKGTPYNIVATIEKAQDNNIKNAFQYILLHELGHIFSIGEKIHPSWSYGLRINESIGDYTFAPISWFWADGFKYTSKFDHFFPERKLIAFYRGPDSKYDATKMKVIYEKLEKTNFPTLYGATNPFDDFAEAFVTYVHSVMMKKQFKIEIKKGKKLIHTFSLCWDEKRCAKKRKILEALLLSK